MTEHDRRLVEEWQSSCEGVTERRLRDFVNALDDLRSLSSKRQGAQILRASRHELKEALRSLHDLYQDTEPSLIIRLSELMEVYASGQ